MRTNELDIKSQGLDTNLNSSWQEVKKSEKMKALFWYQLLKLI